MLTTLDHTVVAVRDLDAATRTYASLLGRTPSWRGVHPGAGTANTLFRLENAYLELLSQEGEGPVGAMLGATLEGQGEGLVALAFGTDDADACATELRARGIAAADPQDGTGRDEESGQFRQWRNVMLPTDATRGLLLFAIEHRSPPDALPLVPSFGAAGSCPDALDHAVVWSPELEASARLYGEGLGLRLALDRTFEKRGIRIHFYRVGGITVEVVGRLDAPPEGGATDRFGGLAYRVADVAAARSRLTDAGFDVSEIRDGAKPGTQVCTIRKETCGVPTLLIEPPAR